jgi:hypothetical protein
VKPIVYEKFYLRMRAFANVNLSRFNLIIIALLRFSVARAISRELSFSRVKTNTSVLSLSLSPSSFVAAFFAH